MSPVLAALLTTILVSPEVCGKTITGYFKSESARRQNGQFITRFMYQGNDGDNDHDSGNRDDKLLSCNVKTCLFTLFPFMIQLLLIIVNIPVSLYSYCFAPPFPRYRLYSTS